MTGCVVSNVAKGGSIGSMFALGGMDVSKTPSGGSEGVDCFVGWGKTVSSGQTTCGGRRFCCCVAVVAVIVFAVTSAGFRYGFMYFTLFRFFSFAGACLRPGFREFCGTGPKEVVNKLIGYMY